MTEGFGPKVSGFDHFEFGNHHSLKKKIFLSKLNAIGKNKVAISKYMYRGILLKIN